MSSYSETAERLLDVAEELFAERGFAETSLRTITSKAGTNLAAVNYHFGSKKALIQAVFARFLTPMMDNLNKELDKPECQNLSLDDLLHIVAKIILNVTRNPEQQKRLPVVMSLIGLAYIQSQGHLRKFIEEEYRCAFSIFIARVQTAVPNAPAVDLFWGLHFMLGAVAFTMASITPLSKLVESQYGSKTTIDEVINRLIPFLATGMCAINSPLSDDNSEPRLVSEGMSSF